jgi:transcription elongation factor Elf1
MQIIYNSLTGKDITNNYTCDKCNSIISVSKGEMFTGYLGDHYFKCPVCGKYTVAETLNSVQKAEDIIYPVSFHNYIRDCDCTPYSCTDADVNGLIQDIFKDGFDSVKMNMAEFGDTMVLAIEDGVDNNDKPVYKLYVCKDVDTTTCTES